MSALESVSHGSRLDLTEREARDVEISDATPSLSGQTNFAVCVEGLTADRIADSPVVSRPRRHDANGLSGPCPAGRMLLKSPVGNYVDKGGHAAASARYCCSSGDLLGSGGARRGTCRLHPMWGCQ